MTKLLTNDKFTPEEFGEAAVDLFVKSYDPAEDPYLALSVSKLDACSELERKMKDLTAVLITAIDAPENRAAIDRAWLRDVSFEVDGFIDLGAFCMFIQEEMSGNTDVCSAAEDVCNALSKVVLHHRVAPEVPDRKISLATGLTIWFPPWIRFPGVNYAQIDLSKRYLFNGYELTRFAQVTNWDRFLSKLYLLTQGQ
jgi:hypothetical protein